MKHYEEHLQRDLDQIRGELAESGAAVEVAVRRAVHALLTGDRDQASQVILGDLAINRALRAVDQRCHAFVVRHLPSAGHLRFVSSALRVNVALERIGDYAVTIARECVQLAGPPPELVARDVELLAEHARQSLAQAISAFVGGNGELARGTAAMAGQVKTTFRRVFADLLAEGEELGPSVRLKDLFALLVVLNRLERVGDQAKNLCEETLFAVAGETKAPKVYQILFLDRDNTGCSKMAELFARKAFPESGRYTSRGWEAAPSLDPGMVEFMTSLGYSVAGEAPRRLLATPDELAGFHVIVGVGWDPWEHLREVPFHTVALKWDVGEGLAATDPEATRARLAEVYQDLSVHVRELMQSLRGEGAG